MTRSSLLLLALTSAGGCILLPPSVRERLAETVGEGGGGDATGGSTAEGGQSNDGGAGGQGGSEWPDAPLPICEPGQLAGDGCATVAQLGLGDLHSCLLGSDGFVRCWGSNWNGELGDPDAPAGSNHPPRLVVGLSGVHRLAAGKDHTCAMRGTAAYCWGHNDRGQLGMGDLVNRASPTRVPIDEPIRAISTQFQATCALTMDDDVLCWGFALNGQLWEGSAFTSTPTPVEGLDDLPGIAELTVGHLHACVLAERREVMRCWGSNHNGRLGDGTGAPSVSAVTVTDALKGPVEGVAFASGRSCAYHGEVGLQCWGYFSDLLGVDHDEPVDFAVAPSSPIVTLDSGWSHVCRLQADGVVRCFGTSMHGELGPEGLDGLPQPDPVAVLGNVAMFAAGWQHSCALLQNGEVRCWGRNQFGQTAPTSQAIKVTNPTVLDLSP